MFRILASTKITQTVPLHWTAKARNWKTNPYSTGSLAQSQNNLTNMFYRNCINGPAQLNKMVATISVALINNIDEILEKSTAGGKYI